MKVFRLLAVLILALTFSACATSIADWSGDYQAMSKEVKTFARISADDWLFGSGIIQGALPEDALPAWVFTELKTVDKWCEEGRDLTEHELGYMVGVRFRLAGPIIKTAIEQYAPGVMNVTEVLTVLSFLGL